MGLNGRFGLLDHALHAGGDRQRLEFLAFGVEAVCGYQVKHVRFEVWVAVHGLYHFVG